MLLPIDTLLTPQEVHYCRQQLAAGPWQDGSLTAGTLAVQVKRNLQLDDHSEQALQLRQLILGKLQSHPLFVSATLPSRYFPPKFNCYQDGGHYGLHVDNAILALGSPEQLRSDVSCTLFLNSPDEYDGGELVIETRYGAQQVKLEAGSLIIYPSTSLHQVLPVTAGQRICSFFWIQSLIRDAHQREMLFELDQSVQALTVALGEGDAEVSRLSQLYHNLLREWAV
ncbi:Fe2+-dependent dioxygenase [Candidatus Thalassolituus haligoni]|uniref:Fe2+-dependent dioxygenase n=1 Tax=Candidatus Thalassolituus haligoni TaxID=3100113 RepID=UPI003515D3EE|tara:strand:+ start:3114 stop:3791 length:678 start_codon:yes stop_codon:yes gene_type:complete